MFNSDFVLIFENKDEQFGDDKFFFLLIFKDLIEIKLGIKEFDFFFHFLKYSFNILLLLNSFEDFESLNNEDIKNDNLFNSKQKESYNKKSVFHKFKIKKRKEK